MNQTTGDHFNKPGHSISNMKITLLEKVKSTDPIYRKERAKYHIRKLNTFYNGMNKNIGVGSVSKTLTTNLLYCQYIPDNQEEKIHIKNSSKASPKGYFVTYQWGHITEYSTAGQPGGQRNLVKSIFRYVNYISCTLIS